MRFKTFVLIAIVAVGLQAQNTEMGGYLKLFAHPDINSPYNWEQLGTRMQVYVGQSLGEQAAFYSALNFTYDVLTNTMRIKPVEAYMDFFSDFADLRLGRQFIFWGKTDWINPTDNINPWDYRNITAEIEDYRLPVLAAKADLYLGDADLQLVWLPKFEPNRIPMAIPDSIAGFPVQHLPEALPENNPAHSEAGLRLAASAFHVDYAFSYYYGYEKNPTVRIEMIPMQGQFVHSVTYNRQHVFGFDFVTTFDKLAFKGEGAWFLTADRDGKDIFAENPHIQYVLGADYNVNDQLSLNAQFIQNIRLKYDREYETQTRLARHMPLTDVPEQYVQSISGRMQYRWNDFLTMQFISVLNLKDSDYFVLPILSYAYADGINLYLGATLFGGPENSTFGRSKNSSRAFAELKFSF